jgi:NADPH:quinone reductase-like Zn-dependent oxidoreductase
MKSPRASAANQAVRIHRFGGPSVLQLETIPCPVPRPGQVLVEVHAASVNPVDTKIRAGKFKLFRPELPAIMGRDISGVVRAIGGHRRSSLSVGDRVFGMLDYERGGYTRYLVATPRELARCPAAVSHLEATTLGVAAMTAWQCLFDHGRLKRGERVLIHGGAGGVWHFAVQFAKVHGATVIATAGPQDLAWVKSLGADRVIDYHNEKFENEVGNVDLVLDLIAGEVQERSWQVLKERGGRIVSTLMPPSPVEAKRHRASGTRMVVHVDRDQLAKIAQLVVEKKVRVKIGKTFPLAQAAAAQKLIENGHVRGKVVLTVK